MDVRNMVRTVLMAVSAILLLQIGGAAQAQPAPRPPATAQPQLRMKWQDFVNGPDGAKRLASLEKAVAKMKSLNSSPKNSADYRRSWDYWANIHGYYGPSSPDGTVADQISYLKSNNMSQYVRFYTGISDQTPPDSIAQAIWATCQHSYTDNQNQLHQANFFGWHRMYLYYYERVLRWAAQDDTLRLPYWDYTDPTQEAVPAAFRKSASPLFDAKRNARMNSGAAKLNANSTNINSFLTNTNYLAAELSVEEGVHGYVHCTVGPTCPVAHMGDVPVAGNDPVFYSHHANIDRIWACWQTKNGDKPTGQPWEDEKFSFVDETGTMQTRPVKDFLNSAALGYVYDHVSDCARKPAVAIAAVTVPAAGIPPAGSPAAATLAAAPTGEAGKPATVHAIGSIAITSPTTTVDLNVPATAMMNAFAGPMGTARKELVLHNVTADSPPNTLFNVYLAVKGDPAKRVQIGTISWFGAFGASRAKMHEGAMHAGPTNRTYTFDVTDALRSLGGGGAADLTVVIDATDGLVPTNSTQGLAPQQEAQTAFRPESNMRIGSMELRNVPASQPTP